MNEIVFAKKGFSLERLRLLCEVARTGGIRAAVGDDPVRQSLASRQLRELSEYAGLELTQRIGRGLEMTVAGEELVEIGNEFFAKMASFLQRVREFPIEFRLGVGDSIFQWHILPRMKDFESMFNKVKLISYSYPTAEIVRAVESRRLDAGLVRSESLVDSELVARPVGEIRYKLFIPMQLGNVDSGYRLPSISGVPFCTLTGDGAYSKAMTQFLSAFNGAPSLNCSSMTQMYAAVQSGQYAAILPANAEAGMKGLGVRVLTLPELASFTRRISLVFKADAKTRTDKSAILDFLGSCMN